MKCISLGLIQALIRRGKNAMPCFAQVCRLLRCIVSLQLQQLWRFAERISIHTCSDVALHANQNFVCAIFRHVVCLFFDAILLSLLFSVNKAYFFLLFATFMAFLQETPYKRIVFSSNYWNYTRENYEKDLVCVYHLGCDLLCIFYFLRHFFLVFSFQTR